MLCNYQVLGDYDDDKYDDDDDDEYDDDEDDDDRITVLK
jgi:hypothetical protein